MANRIYISCKEDGEAYKDELHTLLQESSSVIEVSEHKDYTKMSQHEIQMFLNKKLVNTSVTIVIMTPSAIKYRRGEYGLYEDWMYDELKYSFDKRDDIRSNGILAIYTEDIEHLILNTNSVVSEQNLVKFNNLISKNMINLKAIYKENPLTHAYNSLNESYVTLVSFDDFINDFQAYINNALSKRYEIHKYNIRSRMDYPNVKSNWIDDSESEWLKD